MRIAVLDDDQSHLNFVCRTLTTAGHICHAFTQGRALKKSLLRDSFDLLVLDWNVPDLSGEAVLKWVRSSQCGQSTPLPIVFLTVRDHEVGITRILDAGADDYLVKPISGNVLRARIDSLLRRAYQVEVAASIQEFGLFRFDLRHKQAYIGSRPASLTQKEFDLALLLFQHLNQPLSRAYILDLVWRQETDFPSRTIDTHISMIRTKLELRPDNGYRLAPIYSYGYRLDKVVDIGFTTDPER